MGKDTTKKTSSIKKMVSENYKRKNLHWRVIGNNKMFNVNGTWFDEHFYEQMFPKWELFIGNVHDKNPSKYIL